MHQTAFHVHHPARIDKILRQQGGHAFAVTLAEHEANVQKALEAGLL